MAWPATPSRKTRVAFRVRAIACYYYYFYPELHTHTQTHRGPDAHLNKYAERGTAQHNNAPDIFRHCASVCMCVRESVCECEHKSQNRRLQICTFGCLLHCDRYTHVSGDQMGHDSRECHKHDTRRCSYCVVDAVGENTYLMWLPSACDCTAHPSDPGS